MLTPSSQPTLRRRSWLAGMGLGAAALATGCSAPAVQSAPAPATPEPAPGTPLGPVSVEDRQWLERLSWGANDSLAREFQAMGRERWLAMQLTPQWPPTLPPVVKAQIDALDISRKPMLALARASDEQRKAWVAMKGDEQVAARQAWQQEMARLTTEAVNRQLLRSLYAREQLQDQMGWFWFNHFNVYAQKANLRVMMGDYDDTIRPLALGRFRDLLGAVIHHPAMLRYLDNDQNRVGKLNENLGRELLELHTLGVDGGYSQQDVQEMARVLTGFGLQIEEQNPRMKPEFEAQYLRRGLFEFNPQRHDPGSKKVLGETVQGQGGVAELNGVLDRLARHPSTARHICRKIAVYLVADEPSPALVQKLSARYLASDGRIDQVLRELFAAPEFAASLNKRFKDPMQFVLSAVRQCHDGQTVVNTQPMRGWLQRLGEAPYTRVTPDGFPLESSAWNGQGQLTARFELARIIVTGGNVNNHLFRAEGAPPLAQVPQARARGELFKTAIEPTLARATKLALTQAATPREADALWLSSPEFMWR